MRNQLESPTKSRREDPFTSREQRTFQDRIQTEPEYSHPNSANVGGGKVLNQFLIKRQAKVGT